MRYRDLVVSHMNCYACQRNIGGGLWHKRPYKHVLEVDYINGKMDTSSQNDVIIRNNILSSASTGKVLIPKAKWQSDAHHLNSSQVMCYNFFRPMLNDDSTINELGRKFFGEVVGISLKDPAVGEFEYEDKSDEWRIDRKGRATNFDFHVSDAAAIEIFIEVKYTEGKFGGASHNDAEKYAFYQTKAKEVLNLSPEVDEIKRSYQLFRNSIRISKNSYSICLFPKKNNSVSSEFNSFKTLIDRACPIKEHFKCVYLEDCTDYLKQDFIEKYLQLD